ncbi:hypothetical protein L1049_026695 [Liquidambar formosana]|uniref:Uncharacterized protein n=1 Tax=Liquidambar formosana TaxID=63359 RepID=A0AAP0NF91_LIQFO
MRGIGGPLLCIGDLLSDIGEGDGDLAESHQATPQAISDSTPQTTDLTQLFQENYNHLNEALAGTDHSWTALTLKLCTTVETANKLIQSTNSNVTSLSEKIEELERIIKRGDSTIAAAKAINISLNQKNGPFTGCQNIKQTGPPRVQG